MAKRPPLVTRWFSAGALFPRHAIAMPRSRKDPNRDGIVRNMDTPGIPAPGKLFPLQNEALVHPQSSNTST